MHLGIEIRDRQPRDLGDRPIVHTLEVKQDHLPLERREPVDQPQQPIDRDSAGPRRRPPPAGPPARRGSPAPPPASPSPRACTRRCGQPGTPTCAASSARRTLEAAPQRHVDLLAAVNDTARRPPRTRAQDGASACPCAATASSYSRSRRGPSATSAVPLAALPWPARSSAEVVRPPDGSYSIPSQFSADARSVLPSPPARPAPARRRRRPRRDPRVRPVARGSPHPPRHHAPPDRSALRSRPAPSCPLTPRSPPRQHHRRRASAAP